VVAGDIDPDAGIAAIWLERRTRLPGGGIEEICSYERISGNWRYIGGSGSNSGKFAPAGRRSSAVTGPGSMLTHLGTGAGRSSADREAHGDQLDPSRAGWIGATTFRAAAEITHLQVGTRQIEVPEHGHVVVVWKAPPTWRARRPPIAALGADGSTLSELGPDSHLDTLSWAAISEATGEPAS
jgi:hypothetical protein